MNEGKGGEGQLTSEHGKVNGSRRENGKSVRSDLTLGLEKILRCGKRWGRERERNDGEGREEERKNSTLTFRKICGKERVRE